MIRALLRYIVVGGFLAAFSFGGSSEPKCVWCQSEGLQRPSLIKRLWVKYDMTCAKCGAWHKK